MSSPIRTSSSRGSGIRASRPTPLVFRKQVGSSSRRSGMPSRRPTPSSPRRRGSKLADLSIQPRRWPFWIPAFARTRWRGPLELVRRLAISPFGHVGEEARSLRPPIVLPRRREPSTGSPPSRGHKAVLSKRYEHRRCQGKAIALHLVSKRPQPAVTPRRITGTRASRRCDRTAWSAPAVSARSGGKPTASR